MTSIRFRPVVPAGSSMLPDWSSVSITATVGRAMVFPVRVKTKFWPVSAQWIVTEPGVAVVPAPEPVNWNQIRTSTYATPGFGWATAVAPSGEIAYAPVGAAAVSVMSVIENTRNTAALSVVSPTGTSLKLIAEPGGFATSTVVGNVS